MRAVRRAASEDHPLHRKMETRRIDGEREHETRRSAMAWFAPFLRDFFVKGTDAKFNREIKLEILVRLATPDSVEEILRELQTYCQRDGKRFRM